MKDPLLESSASWVGRWWLPTAADASVPGILTYEPAAGLSLTLIGGFQERDVRQEQEHVFSVGEEFRTWPMLHGFASNQEITLLDCTPTSSRSFGLKLFGGPDEQRLNAGTALVGVHLDAPDAAIFSEVKVAVENLTAWATASGMSIELGVDDDSLTGRGTLTIDRIDASEASMAGVTVTLDRSYILPTFDQARGRTVGRAWESANITFRPTAPCNLDVVHEYVGSMRDLLSLASHQACGLLWMSTRVAPAASGESAGDARAVDIYERQLIHGDTEKAVSREDFLFSCFNLPFPDAVTAWSRLRDQAGAAINLLLGLRYLPDAYLETELLTSAAAAEVLHRSLKIDEPPIPHAEFRALRRMLTGHLPEDRHEWFKEALGHNDPMLRDRLTALAGRPDPAAMARLLPDPQEWATQTTRARNDLTHTGRSSRHSFDQLYAIVTVTTAVVLINLLHELGIPAERQREIVETHPAFTHATRLTRLHLVSTHDPDHE